MAAKPNFKGIISKIFTIKPKKPNSAIRKIAKIKIKGIDKYILAYIPGEGHTLTEFSTVLIRHGKVQDCPGIKYKIIRGALEFKGVNNRKTSRSIYGAPKK